MTAIAPGTAGQPDPADPASLFAAITTSLAAAFNMIEWAEDEIAQATRRHPAHADTLYHAFELISPRAIGPGMSTEFVYRAHARELLERLAAGPDTRPATAVEVCLACAEASQRAPLHGPGAGLYFRAWLHAFPDHPVTAGHAAQQVHYEHLYGPRIDELEQMLRRKLADPARQLAGVECGGRHHGTSVACRYANLTASGRNPTVVRHRANANPTPTAITAGTAGSRNGQLAPLLAHLQAHPHLDFSSQELGRVLGRSHSTIRRHLRMLADHGQVIRTRSRPARFQIAT